jgi:hypothetical protein
MQLAFVPQDIGAAIRFWTETMGVGPFFKFPHISYERFTYLSQAQTPDFTFYIAYWGDVQIELIEQHNRAPSTYQQWLDDGLEGLHHICIAVDDMDAVRAHCAETGAKIVQKLAMGGLETIYVSTETDHAPFVEFALISPQFLSAFEAMRQAASSWDGKYPIQFLGGGAA